MRNSVGSVHARPKNDSPDGKPHDLPCRNRDVRVAGNRRRRRAAAAEMITVDQVGRPRWPAGGGDQRVETLGVHDSVDPVLTGSPSDRLQSLEIRLVGQRPFRLRLDEQLLTEVRHFPVAVLLVEADDVRERTHRDARRQCCQVRIQVGLEL